MKRKVLVPYLLMLPILLTFGCNITTRSIKETERSNQPVINPTKTSTAVVKESQNTSKPIITEIVISSTPTIKSTNTRTPTPNSTLISTISVTNRDEYVHQLNTLNGICVLPCWGMIIPGKTRYEDAEKYLQSITDDYGWLSYSIYDVIGQDDINVHFTIINHYIKEMYFWRVPYHLDEFLEQNGIPEEIWVRQDYGMPIGGISWPFDLVLFYPSKGILGYLTGESEVSSFDEANICPGKIQEDTQKRPEFELFLWAPNWIKSFSEMAEDENHRFTDAEHYYKLSEASDIRNEDFYKIYKDPQNQDKCFSVDLEKFMKFATLTPTP